jgi:hypothetical protein
MKTALRPAWNRRFQRFRDTNTPILSDQRSRSTWVNHRSEHGESGAVLILALFFLVAVSVIVAGLTDWTTNDLRNSNNFKVTQAVTSNATNAVNLAMQSIRYSPLLYSGATVETLNANSPSNPPGFCWGAGASQQFNMNVYCSSVWAPASATTRTVTISACPMSRAISWAAGQTSCPAHPLLQVIVSYDDYPLTGGAPSLVQCQVYCGTAETVNSWNWNPVIPAIQSVLTLSGPITGGTPITLQGTGFTSGSTVNFVNVNPLAQTASTLQQTVPQIVPATNVRVNGGTITANAPAVITLANYFVTVTTPGAGTSPDNPSFVFNYSSVVPAVTSITPLTGYTTHTTQLIISGSGFVVGATVNMVQESGGVPSSPLVSYAGSAVQVVSDTQINALTYPVGSPSSYFVTVTTPAGASGYGSVSTDVYTFTQAPPP